VVVNASLSGQRGEEQGFVAGLNVRALGHLHIESRCRAGHLSTSSFVRLVQGGQLLVASNNRGDKQQQEGADHFMAVVVWIVWILVARTIPGASRQLNLF
jgi:hypothetical protein